MKKIVIICMLAFSVCSCNRAAINTLKESVKTSQIDLSDLKSQIDENELVISNLKMEKDSLEECLSNICFIVSIKKNIADSLYKKAYPSKSASSSVASQSKNKREVNPKIKNDPRFKIKSAIVF